MSKLPLEIPIKYSVISFVAEHQIVHSDKYDVFRLVVIATKGLNNVAIIFGMVI